MKLAIVPGMNWGYRHTDPRPPRFQTSRKLQEYDFFRSDKLLSMSSFATFHIVPFRLFFVSHLLYEISRRMQISNKPARIKFSSKVVSS
jgi:hypothetical protein